MSDTGKARSDMSDSTDADSISLSKDSLHDHTEEVRSEIDTGNMIQGKKTRTQFTQPNIDTFEGKTNHRN